MEFVVLGAGGERGQCFCPSPTAKLALRVSQPCPMSSPQSQEGPIALQWVSAVLVVQPAVQLGSVSFQWS